MGPIVHLVEATIQLSTLALLRHYISCAKHIIVTQFTRIPLQAATRVTIAASMPLQLSYPHPMDTTRRICPRHMRRDSAMSKSYLQLW